MSDFELSEPTESGTMYTFDDNTAHQKRYRKIMNMLIVLTAITSLILIILVLQLCFAMYLYRTQVNRVDELMGDAQTVLKEWDTVYKSLQPYLAQMKSLFDITKSVGELVTVTREIELVWPRLEKSLLGLNNFTHQATQFMDWSETCAKSYGICTM